MSNRNLEHLRPALAEIAEAGARYEILLPRSNCVKLWIFLGNQKRLVIAAKTPSDYRAPLAIRMHVRRAINEMKGN